MSISIWVGGVCTAVIVLLLLGAAAGSPLVRADLPGTTAYAALCSAPWVLAVGGCRNRSALLAPAGVLAVAGSPLLWSGMILLLAPGLLYVWAFARARPARPQGGRRLALMTVPVLLVGVAWALLLADGVSRCAEDSGRTTCSDVVPPGRAMASVLVAGAGVGGGWLLSRG